MDFLVYFFLDLFLFSASDTRLDVFLWLDGWMEGGMEGWRDDGGMEWLKKVL